MDTKPPNGRDGEGGATYLAHGSDEVGFPRGRTALLVIDPVNDFLSEGGAAWPMTKTTVTMNGVVENLKRAIAGARQRGIPVLLGPMAYTEDDYADRELHRRSGINRLMFEHKMFLAGSWGADFHPELRPQGDDIVLLPHKGTDVFETDLPDHLRRLGITHLVIGGMTANLCCESTGRHATEAGYDVTFLSDAVGSESIPSYEAAIHINFPLIANGVMKVDEFLAALDAPAAGRASVQAGDTVRGSDHGEIGQVKEVVAATGEHRAYMLVPRGLIFETDTFIPLDAVVRRAGTDVFINVPKLVVGSMPWSEPPSRREHGAKQGPNAAAVDRLYGSRSPTVHETGPRA
ncbi:MAG TPA: isochorismatase family cysteine hydrolase [Longimicrobiaceae bacterium]|nr:isochorismatase family cysteine hydrolase [Longimicrobiaceae bacterium]